MNALDALCARTQPGYETAVHGIVASLRATFGDHVFEGLAVEETAERLTGLLEQRPAKTADCPSAVVIRDLQVLDWCCGLPLSESLKARLAALLRRDYRLQFEAAGLKRPKTDVAARRSHVVFAGTLASPTHSPSIAAVGYLRALCADIKTRRVEVYHHGPIDPELRACMAERLPASVSFHQIEQHPDYLATAAARAPCTYHFWCYPRTNVDYSFLAMFGPTVMFTCADDPPLQYADAYWSCQEAGHVERVWAHAPASFRANFVSAKSASLPLPTPLKVRSKADLGVAEGELLLTTVGSRLAIDLDETFVSGVEAVLRERRHCRWLVVGALPERLQEAMHLVLGRQFLHVGFDADLAGLMPAADLWLNPLRRGGGNSAVIAGRAGVAILARGDIGDVASCLPREHWASDAADYFAKLDALLDDPGQRAAWAKAQGAFLDARLDEGLYARELDRIGALAFERFRARAKRPLDILFPEPTEVAAAA